MSDIIYIVESPVNSDQILVETIQENIIVELKEPIAANVTVNKSGGGGSGNPFAGTFSITGDYVFTDADKNKIAVCSIPVIGTAYSLTLPDTPSDCDRYMVYLGYDPEITIFSAQPTYWGGVLYLGNPFPSSDGRNGHILEWVYNAVFNQWQMTDLTAIRDAADLSFIGMRLPNIYLANDPVNAQSGIAWLQSPYSTIIRWQDAYKCTTIQTAGDGEVAVDFAFCPNQRPVFIQNSSNYPDNVVISFGTNTINGNASLTLPPESFIQIICSHAGTDFKVIASSHSELLNHGVMSIVEGANITVDNTDPRNPVVSASGGGGGSLPTHTGANKLLATNSTNDGDVWTDEPTLSKVHVSGDSEIANLMFTTNSPGFAQLGMGYNYAGNDGGFWINYSGYQNSNSFYRNMAIGNGKNGLMDLYIGSSNEVLRACTTDHFGTTTGLATGRIRVGGDINITGQYLVNGVPFSGGGGVPEPPGDGLWARRVVGGVCSWEQLVEAT